MATCCKDRFRKHHTAFVTSGDGQQSYPLMINGGVRWLQLLCVNTRVFAEWHSADRGLQHQSANEGIFVTVMNQGVVIS